MCLSTARLTRLPVGLTLCFFVFVFSNVPKELKAQQSTNDSEELIRRILQDQAGAWNDGDIDRFMKHYWKSPNLTFSSSGKVVRGWQATLDRYRTKYSTREKMGRLKFDHLEITLLGDSAALVLGNWQLARPDDNPRGNFSLIFRKTGDHWKIIHDHTSSLEESN